MKKLIILFVLLASIGYGQTTGSYWKVSKLTTPFGRVLADSTQIYVKSTHTWYQLTGTVSATSSVATATTEGKIIAISTAPASPTFTGTLTADQITATGLTVGTATVTTLISATNIFTNVAATTATVTTLEGTTGTFTGALEATTLNTGQGANELYDMDQNVETTSDVTFNSLTAGTVTITTLATSGGNIVGTNITSTGTAFFDSTLYMGSQAGNVWLTFAIPQVGTPRYRIDLYNLGDVYFQSKSGLAQVKVIERDTADTETEVNLSNVNNITAGGTVTATTMAGTTGSFTGALSSATINTGQGDNELYEMDQHVKTTSNVAFNQVIAGTVSGTVVVQAPRFKVAQQDTTGVGSTANIGTIMLHTDGNFYGLTSGTPPVWVKFNP